METITHEEIEKALDRVQDRVDWVGTLYGSRWREELAFLQPIKDSLKKLMNIIDTYRERTVELPSEGKRVLIECSGYTADGVFIENKTCIGFYQEDQWWTESDIVSVVYTDRWRTIPKWDERTTVERRNVPNKETEK